MDIRELSSVLVSLEDVQNKPPKVVFDKVRELIREHPAAFGLRWVVEEGDWQTQCYLKSEPERGY